MAVLKKKKGKQPQKLEQDYGASASSDGAAQSQIRLGRVTAQKLNLRSKPIIRSSKVDVLEQGTTVNILGKEGDWLKIEHEGRKGFV
ncbi:SH3 domain-containing protein, partial [candidate division KSB1 bacterium]|nr:SH3 domain-containing protein [candidate division KSB1 bacterium]